MQRLSLILINKNSLNLVRRMSQMRKKDNIVWMDMEMTGLDLDVNRVIQVAMVVTDSNLNVISPEFATVIKQSDKALTDDMNIWCKQNLKDLAALSKRSEVTEAKAQDMMMEFLSPYVVPKKSPLAGNSIYMDRMFLRKYFPRVDDLLHYRIIDVSTVKELCRRWNPKVLNEAPAKKLQHRALEDIRESIQEMQHYKKNFFIVNDTLES